MLLEDLTERHHSTQVGNDRQPNRLEAPTRARIWPAFTHDPTAPQRPCGRGWLIGHSI